MRLLRHALIVLIILAAGCSEPTGPGNDPGLTIRVPVTADTVEATLPPLRIALRDSAGRAMPDVDVTLTDLHRGDTRVFLYVSPTTQSVGDATATLRTNSRGEAAAYVTFGQSAGEGRLRVSYPIGDDGDFGADTISFTVLPGEATAFVPFPADTAVFSGRSFELELRAADRHGNHRAEAATGVSFTALDTEVTVSQTGTVNSQSIGRAAVELETAAWTDTAWVSVVPQATLAVAAHHLSPIGLYLMNTDGSGLEFLALDDFGDLAPQWHPDGTGIIVHGLSSVDVNGLQLVDPDGSVVDVREDPPTFQHKAWPEYSADGEWIWFAGHRTDQTSSDVHVWRMHPDGTGVEQISTVPATMPSPSPDDTRVVWSSSGIIVLHIRATGQSISVIEGSNPRWSPDGDWIAFNGLDARDYGLWVMRRDGTFLRRLGTARVGFAFDWSPDGTYLVAKLDSHDRLTIIRASDGEEMPLNTFTRLFREAAWRP